MPTLSLPMFGLSLLISAGLSLLLRRLFPGRSGLAETFLEQARQEGRVVTGTLLHSEQRPADRSHPQGTWECVYRYEAEGRALEYEAVSGHPPQETIQLYYSAGTPQKAVSAARAVRVYGSGRLFQVLAFAFLWAVVCAVLYFATNL